MNGPTSVRTADASDVSAVRALLARAYVDDPLMAWVFPDRASRPHAVAAWLALFVEPAVHAGSVDLVAGPQATRGSTKAAAVAVWRPEPAPPAAADALPSVGGLLAALVGAEHAARVGRGLAALRPLAPRHPSSYLQFLAVDPDAQRSGLGRRVLAPGLARAAAAGRGVHLETANPGSLLFYAASGVPVTAELDLPEGGPHLWGLAAQPPAAVRPALEAAPTG